MGIFKKFFSRKREEAQVLDALASSKEIMSNTYAKKRWGGQQTDFYSGDGSHSKKLVKPYVREVSQFLGSFEDPLVVCDVGCGDFNVGRQLVPYAKKYIGVDIVDALIDRNNNEFRQENLEFRCLNISEDALPDADCILIRQVLQHLSNNEISRVVKKIRTYKHVIVTEHLPKGGFSPNLDKPTGAGIRLSKKSGVVLTEPPFELNPETTKELLNISYRGGRIVTTYFSFQ
ncbi:class I SAM-dependent methyltransferase [Allomuricauda sp. d1]|uniref:class I SAM-dependent methyltransferase n=1 Tax=Allomuricauda sp. d1 TaxID=3136725 RepID=UPI0031DE47E0